MAVVSRKAAMAAGLIHYWTGKPCKFGHIDKRYVASFQCATCSRNTANKIYSALDVESRKQLTRERRAYQRQWCKEHPASLIGHRQANKLKHPDYFKQFYASNKERRKQESQAWYRANTERASERQKAYDAKHPEQVRAASRRSASKRRAIKARVFVETVDPHLVFQRDLGVCGICKQSVDQSSNWEIDHVIPISRGGAHGYDNVQLAHRKCNRAKWASMPVGQPTLFQIA